MAKLSTAKPVRTDWEARFQCDREPEVKVLEKPFAGIPAGARMVVVTPRAVDEIVAEIPHGQVLNMPALRRMLAARHDAEHACPVTTGIALRVVAERGHLRMQGRLGSVTPFWRAIDPESDLAGKLACGRDFLRTMRADEATRREGPRGRSRRASHPVA
jgi:hypothetical protein